MNGSSAQLKLRPFGLQNPVPAPTSAAYMINVASYKNGVGYGRWIHIDGWSEAVIDYIRSFEAVDWIN